MTRPADNVVDTARAYYDSDDADNFYYHVWGGEDIHIGLYESEKEPIVDASRRTVDRMAGMIRRDLASARLLDIGAGYGGSARRLAERSGCHCTCLNLSSVQNRRNREATAARGLADRIEVVDGNFEDLPFADSAFEVVWCQDSILHSGDRERVFREVDRVLRSGGEFIFTDPMQTEDVDPAVLQPVLDRIHLASMGSIATYRNYADRLGWEVLAVEDLSPYLPRHYGRVLEELESREDELLDVCSRDYLERMKTGLRHWIRAGRDGALAWGILHFRKP
ncbi:MAG: methyltransferase domain-containing protein [Puniceicoccaceae bacterium]|nr:MAG: methyltransferase domain-containing protein [Puniceicoccaceae bacterium]